jgi:hypothetical protein
MRTTRSFPAGQTGANEFEAKGMEKRLKRKVIIMKKFLLMLAFLAIAGVATQANAGVHVAIGFGGGPYYGGYYAPAPGYYGGYYPSYPYYDYYDNGPAIYVGPGYYPWYNGYWYGGYHHFHHYHGGYSHH